MEHRPQVQGRDVNHKCPFSRPSGKGKGGRRADFQGAGTSTETDAAVTWSVVDGTVDLFREHFPD